MQSGKKQIRGPSLQIERLEDRLALATVNVPASVISGTSTTGNARSGVDSSSMFVSLGGSTSADGRFTVYTSEATNLVAGQNDTPGTADVFLFDAQTKEVILVSRVNGSTTTAAKNVVGFPKISADGSSIIYGSRATNVVAGQEGTDNNNGQDIFLFNRNTGVTKLVSRVDGSASQTGDGPSGLDFAPVGAAISANGRFVAFNSKATNLMFPVVTDLQSALDDVFLFDSDNNSLTLVSRSNTVATETADNQSLTPVISADGRFVAYTSAASNLANNQNDTNGTWDVFLFDRQTGVNRLVSAAFGSATTTANNATFSDQTMDISDDGRYLVFRSFASNLVTDDPNQDPNGNSDIFLFDRDEFPGQNVQLVSHAHGLPTTASSGGAGFSDTPVISGNGQYVAYLSSNSNIVAPGVDTNGQNDVFLFDRLTGENILVSRAHRANLNDPLTSAGGASESPAISFTGDLVAFSSTAGNVVDDQQNFNSTNDAFLFNRATGTNELVSGATNSATDTTGGAVSDISSDGSTVVFTSSSGTVVFPGDDNGERDVFVRMPAPAPPTFSFRAATFVTEEIDGTMRVRVDRTGDTTVAASVDIKVFSNANAGDTATAGADFVAVEEATISFAAGETSHTFDITIFDDSADEADETFRAELSGPSPGSLLGPTSTAIITIQDNDEFVPPTFSFRAETLTADENDGKVRIRVDRSGDSTAAAAVDMRILGNSFDPPVPGLTATDSVDFVAGTVTLVFAPEEITQVFEATILDDRAPEGDETFRAELIDSTPGSVIGTPSITTITIEDNDGLGLININTAGTGTSDKGVSASNFSTKLSADGRFIAFQSDAQDLVGDGFVDGNGSAQEIFLRDRLLGTTTLVNHNAAHSASGNGSSHIIDISPNGVFVLYASRATDLVAGVTDENNGDDIFLFNRLTGNNSLVSVSQDPNRTGNGGSSFGSFSPDGQFVLFVSEANDLVADGADSNNSSDLYLRGVSGEATTLVSKNLAGSAAGKSGVGQMSLDRRFVLFPSATPADELVAGVSDPFRGSNPNNETAQFDLFVRDLQEGTTSLVTVKHGANATSESPHQGGLVGPTISADGRFVAFSSFASDLVPDGVDPNPFIDIFLRDLNNGTTKLIRGQSDGTDHRFGTNEPMGFSSDSRFLLFQSPYASVVSGVADNNGASDVFVYDTRDNITIPVSVNAAGTEMASPVPGDPLAHAFLTSRMSADGRFVAFTTAATNLESGLVDPGDSLLKVALRDLQTGKTTIVSRDAAGPLSSLSVWPEISANGQFVAFHTFDTSVIDGLTDFNGASSDGFDLYVSPGAFEPGTFELASVDVNVVEGEAKAFLTINRTGGSNGAVFVFFTAETTGNGDGHAKNVEDFTAGPDSILFLDGETSVTIGIPLRDDQADEGSETFKVTLTNPADRLGNNTVAIVTIVDNDTFVVGNQIVEEDGDIVSVSLKGPGTMNLSLNDPDENLRGPIQVALTGTTAAKSTLNFKVTKKGGDGFANVEKIFSDGGLKSIAGAKVNLTGDGDDATADLDVQGTLVSLALRDVLNGADIKLGGTPAEFNKLTFRDVGNGSDMNIGSGIKTLTAARIGNGLIVAPSLQTLSVKGAKAVKATKTTAAIPAVPGDISAKILLSGAGIPAGKETLKKVTIAHDMVDAIFSVFGGAGNIGTVTVNGRMLNSGISAGYTPPDFLNPNDPNFLNPLTGGTFGPALNIKSVAVNNKLKEGPAINNSVIAATTIGTVTLESVDESAIGIQYGILADVSINGVILKSLKFKLGKFTSPVDEVLKVNNVNTRFHIKVGTDE